MSVGTLNFSICGHEYFLNMIRCWFWQNVQCITIARHESVQTKIVGGGFVGLKRPGQVESIKRFHLNNAAPNFCSFWSYKMWCGCKNGEFLIQYKLFLRIRYTGEISIDRRRLPSHQLGHPRIFHYGGFQNVLFVHLYPGALPGTDNSITDSECAGEMEAVDDLWSRALSRSTCALCCLRSACNWARCKRNLGKCHYEKFVETRWAFGLIDSQATLIRGQIYRAIKAS